MDFLPKEIEEYVEKLTTPEYSYLNELNRETWEKVLIPRMLSGHIQGRILSMFSHMIQPKRILEIGTYTGYSALCLAEGLTENGKIFTIDNNEEISGYLKKYAEKSGFKDNVVQLIGDAKSIIPTLDEQWDIVFIDADKENYSNYYDLVFDKIRKGGFIIADNVLWSGKVVEENEKIDKDTRALIDYSKKIHADERVENVLMPVRDGLMVARKL
jgi:caffeoyl-CoA O-methyltransferase